mgnify:CR=1 FL=1
MTTKIGQGSERKRRVTFMLDEGHIAELEAIAQGHRVSLAWVIRDAVKMYLSDRAPLVRPAASRQLDRRGM